MQMKRLIWLRLQKIYYQSKKLIRFNSRIFNLNDMLTDQILKQKLTLLLRKHEGNKLQVYPDTENEPTIGIGRCLSTKGLTKYECDYLNLGTYDKNSVIAKLEVRGITQEEADYLLSNDIDHFTEQLSKSLYFFNKLPETVKIVLIDMAFNIGISGLLKFKNTLALIEKGKYKLAANEMLNSKWKLQVGQRAFDLANILSEV